MSKVKKSFNIYSDLDIFIDSAGTVKEKAYLVIGESKLPMRLENGELDQKVVSMAISAKARDLFKKLQDEYLNKYYGKYYNKNNGSKDSNPNVDSLLNDFNELGGIVEIGKIYNVCNGFYNDISEYIKDSSGFITRATNARQQTQQYIDSGYLNEKDKGIVINNKDFIEKWTKAISDNMSDIEDTKQIIVDKLGLIQTSG